ncbi:hypothetical protein F8271_10020 [Micromonospora sp. ALFpr18c]|uniref:hypothetical protein n=1 Tax=Micromonospora sp. ALFpr18c TaxID=1458665 RepID=UPI00124B50F9|nr:hypothetical protein [Micromonospora sp. ALFpr18c]KAB1943421.1 hypothetical protein F8271_10020 [Micromonospora sp. ALFpr18c]
METLFVRIAVVGAVVLGLAACSDDGREPSQEEPDITVTAISDVKTLTLPLDTYLPTREQASALLNAENRLKLGCLRRFGFELSVPEGRPRSMAMNERRYGITSVEDAATYGYRLPPKYVVEREKEPEISAAASSVLTGKGQNSYQGQPVPDGGCTGEARRKLTEGEAAKADANLAQNLKAEALNRARNDSRMVATFVKWKACMGQEGYDYSDPLDANDDVQFASGEAASAAEIAVATADVGCKKKTNLVNIWAALDGAYQSRAIEQHGEALAATKRLLETRLRNAAEVVSS